jgi:hypothetical protein
MRLSARVPTQAGRYYHPTCKLQTQNLPGGVGDYDGARLVVVLQFVCTNC